MEIRQFTTEVVPTKWKEQKTQQQIYILNITLKFKAKETIFSWAKTALLVYTLKIHKCWIVEKPMKIICV